MDKKDGCSGCAIVAGFIALGVVLFFGGVLIFNVAWNVMAEAFGFATLDYWQALAFWVVISIIGGAFRTVVSR